MEEQFIGGAAENLVIIGGTAAGLSAASKAKRMRPGLRVQVFERTGYISYGSCGLPYFVGGLIGKPEDLVSVSAETMKTKRGIQTHTHHQVTAINPRDRTVRIQNLETGERSTCPYDKLVIATGAVPAAPPIPGIDSANVHYLRTVEDGIRLKEAVSKGAKTACIIGGGFIGLELAEELTRSGLKVTVLEQLPSLLPFLDPAFSKAVLENLKSCGVTVHTGVTVTKVMAEVMPRLLRTAEGEIITADLILVSAGVRPATELAKEAGLKLGLKGAIVVDDAMRTSDPNIWACGDCVQMKNLITGRPAYIPLGTTANKQGKIAGENAAGGSASFKGVLGSMVTKVFEQHIAATGLTLALAREAGFDAVSTLITKLDKASYYPGGKDNSLCLIFDKGTGRLLGAQGIGSESIAGRVNVLAAAITGGMTVKEVSQLDLVYAPSVAPVYDPVLIAATQALKMQEGG